MTSHKSLSLLISLALSLVLGFGACAEPDPTSDEPDSMLSIDHEAGPELDAELVGADLDALVTAEDMGSEELEPLTVHGDPRSWPLWNSGPFQVGVKRFELTYEPEAWGEARTITMYVWYPTEATEGETLRYLDLFLEEQALKDAPPAMPYYRGGAPVLIHSHGWEGFAGNSAFLMKHFASHGWVVAAPDHTGNLFLSNLDPFPSAFDYVRALDMRLVLDTLGDAVTLAAQGLDTLGPINTDTVLMSGHSYGGYTAWSCAGVTYNMAREREECPACTPEQLAIFERGLGDPRIIGVIPMAEPLSETQIADDGAVSVTIPILMMSGSEDNPERYAQQYDELSALDYRWLELSGGCHNTFGLPPCETLDPEVGRELINGYALAFGRHLLLGDTASEITDLLSGAARPNDRALLRYHQAE